MSYREDAAVGYGNLMCIFAKIFNSVAETVKSFFDIRTPFFFIQIIFELFPVVRRLEKITGEKTQLPVLIKVIQHGNEFSLKLISQDTDWDKKFFEDFRSFLQEVRPPPETER